MPEQKKDAAPAETGELEALRAELDRVRRDNAEQLRQLRACQSREASREAGENAAGAELERKMAEYEKRWTVAENARQAAALLGSEAAGCVAEALYGAADFGLALETIRRVWDEREKKLRMEFGRIPAPGAGSGAESSASPEQLKAMNYRQRLAFARSFPEAYRKMTAR